MPLQDENRRRLTTRGGRHTHDEVAGRILAKLEAVLDSPPANVLDHRLLVPRRARDPGQGLEVPPARAGLDSRQYRAPGSHRGFLAGQGTMCTTTIFVP